jgi:hypothetical protein
VTQTPRFKQETLVDLSNEKNQGIPELLNTRSRLLKSTRLGGLIFSDSPTTSNNLNVISANHNKENKGFTLTKESPW